MNIRPFWVGVCCLLVQLFFRGEVFARDYWIGSYNPENIWGDSPARIQGGSDRGHASLPVYDAYLPGSSNYFEPKVYQSRISNLVEAIRLAGSPDILALQEFEGASVSHDGSALSGNGSEPIWSTPSRRGISLKKELEELGYKYFFLGQQDEGNPVAVTPALISKVPVQLLPPVSVREGVNPSARNIMLVEGNFGGSRVIFFNGHLKSKRDGGEPLRLNQAQAIVERIRSERALQADTRFMIMGDLNAHLGEDPIRVLESLGAASYSPSMLNLWFTLPNEKRWDSTFSGLMNTLSHFMISKDFFGQTGLTYVDRSFHAVGQEGPAAKVLLSAEGIPFRWQLRSDRHFAYHLGKGYSDHLPLVAQFHETTNSQDGHPSLAPRVLEAYQKEQVKGPGAPVYQPVDVCRAEDAVDFEKVDWRRYWEYLGKCIRIDFPTASPLNCHGNKNPCVLNIPLSPVENQSPTNLMGNTFYLAMSMSLSYDWRPNRFDSRFNPSSLESSTSRYSSENPDPRSNQYFYRNILQGGKVSLIHALGRLSYQSGYVALLMATSEAKDIQLTELSPFKEKAISKIRWNQ